ncbi:WD repeat-containing protein [Paracoccidioides lutzii Pb01]|uniref:Probable E3 ubiquitin ligase complex SCF subunit sconB n=1 Tax=Paracoccidioides lutzii (strain ATCC MYA-826 / Pb01) TaxID=502779 RepID=C1H2K2_PARBA|nr:WD repeat-containing protein [Paracoccidioides lutzii Pb01]EEH33946.1 WD repeat-containing protein [Paracoccidioides lutzii Pb01]
MSCSAETPNDTADLTSKTQTQNTSPSPSPIESPNPPPTFQTFPSSFELAGSCHSKMDYLEHLPSNSSIGQFSFAPATQTTVVTTTTTTTTNFPPLVMKAPGSSKPLDPNVYPLASTPTPDSIRDIHFKLGDTSIIFNETEDSLATFDKLKEQRDNLKASNGLIQSVSTSDSRKTTLPRRSRLGQDPPHQTSPITSRLRRRPVSPISLPESSHVMKRTRSSSASLGTNSITRRRNAQSHLDAARLHKDVGLATPETEHGSFNIGNDQNNRRQICSMGSFGKSSFEHSPTSVSQENQNLLSPVPQSYKENVRFVGSQIQKSPLFECRTGSSAEEFACQSTLDNHNHNSNYENNSKPGDDVGQPPLRQSRRHCSAGNPTWRGPQAPARRLLPVDSLAAQDMCLPSPSLSPVTAMNAQNLDTSFDSADEQETDTDSSFDQRSKKQKADSDLNLTVDLFRKEEGYGAALPSPSLSLMDMPLMLDYFESVPDKLKMYMMYQLLRRCPKPTLRFVAGVVNPALKCDFLALLPLELSLNIVKYFDVKTMCRASQVSKKWRHIINSDEKSWKELFESDGYVLPRGELQRAIEEGWGWQCPNPGDDYEKDLRCSTSLKSDSENSIESTSSLAWLSSRKTRQALSPLSVESRRPKRKAATRVTSRKLTKRKSGVSAQSNRLEPVNWMDNMVAAESPYAAANAAALAVPYPDVGLSSLRSLHLYKSLYQRHHLIHKTWMRNDIKPMHIAFRAHDRHVVTCLQFDTDKILTGSDDTNINVYDTKTGALRATLEGHEGGVWALEYHGNTLVSGSTDRSVRVWDIESAECTQIFQGHTSTVRCLQILMPVAIGKLPDGSPNMMPKQPLIITGSRDSNLRLWKLPQPGDPKFFQTSPDNENPYFIRALTGHTHSVRAIAAYGDTLVSGSYDCSVRVWKISTGESVHHLQGHSQKVYSVVLDHKRNRCISGSMDSIVKVWSLDTGAVIYNLEGHSSLVGLLDLQQDRLVSAAADSTLRIWDPETGKCQSVLTAHTGAITCFQHDYQKVISGSDRTLKMWDTRTGKCLKDLLTDLSGVWQVRFNDRRCVAAVQRDRLTYIEVLDFGASRDRVPSERLGKRIVVDRNGEEIGDNEGGAEREGSDD